MNDAISVFITLSQLVGAIVLVSVATTTLYWIATRRPTPNSGFIETVKQMRWGFGILVFVIPQGLVAYQEGLGFAGFALGAGFLLIMFCLSWWLGI